MNHYPLESYSNEEPKPRILIVDDIAKNIMVIANSLDSNNYDIAYATNGADALQLVKADPVDLILLDIMMPDMDGYEVCKQLKLESKTADIPVIFITAKINKTDELKGFKLGAVDFITKPITPFIVNARVKVHIKLRYAQKKLQQQNKQIMAASRIQDDITVMSRHDLKNPLSYIITCSNLILDKEILTEKLKNKIQRIYHSSLTLLDMLNQSLDLVKMENNSYQCKLETVNLSLLLTSVFEENEALINSKKLRFRFTQQEDAKTQKNQDFFIETDKLLLYSIFSNLLKNAIEASTEGQDVTVNITSKENFYLFKIQNQGTIPKSMRHCFFDKYATFGKKNGNGLGTYSAQLMTHTLGGNISFESSEESGTLLSIKLQK